MCLIACLCVCIGEVCCKANSIPHPQGSCLFPGWGGESSGGSWDWKDAVVSDARADIPVPGCYRHVSPGPGADSTYPAKTDAWVKDPAHWQVLPLPFWKPWCVPSDSSLQSCVSWDMPGSQRSPSFPPQLLTWFATLRTNTGGWTWKQKWKQHWTTFAPFSRPSFKWGVRG